MKIVLSLLLLLSGPSVASLAAQRLPDVEPGTRVRLTAPELRKEQVTGDVLFMNSDTLVIELRNGENVEVPVASVERLEISRGPEYGKGLLRGAKYGALTGVGVGALFFLEGVVFDDDGGFYLIAVPFLTGVAAVSGALVGGLVGTIFPPETWEEIPLSPRPEVTAVPGGGIGISVRIALP